MMTRARMEEVIRGGGSVMLGERIISKVEELPSEVELAKGDPEREQQVQQSIEAQIEDLHKKLDELKAGGAPQAEDTAGGAKGEAKTGAGAPAKTETKPEDPKANQKTETKR
jgi:hypothetical protein